VPHFLFPVCVSLKYLRSSVGDALQDPVDGRRVESQVLGHLHPLFEQLLLDAVSADLPEGGEQVEEVSVQAVFQVGGHLYAHLEFKIQFRFSPRRSKRRQINVESRARLTLQR